MPLPEQGDLLAICDTGAYGWSMSSTYNGRPLLPEVLVEDGEPALIRERGGLSSTPGSCRGVEGVH